MGLSVIGAETQQPSRAPMNHWTLTYNLVGSIRLEKGLATHRTRVLQHATDTTESFTEIRIDDPSHRFRRLQITYGVTATTQLESLRVGADYASRICDLLSLVTGVGIHHDLSEDEAMMQFRRSLSQADSHRTLRASEWSWILNNLAHLQLQAPGFMAACRQFRRALQSHDPAARIHGLWSAIEGSALAGLEPGDPQADPTRPPVAVAAFLRQAFEQAPALLAEPKLRRRFDRLARDVARGRKSIGERRLAKGSKHLDELRDTTHRVLQRSAAILCARHSLPTLCPSLVA